MPAAAAVLLLLWYYYGFPQSSTQQDSLRSACHRVTMGDAMAIMDMEFAEAGKEPISASGGRKRERKRATDPAFKRPEGMHRELYALLVGDGLDPAPIISTETGLPGGYKQTKAKLGLKKVRPWEWMEFVNPGRRDGFRLKHWKRKADAGKEYPFAKFNKQVAIESYSQS